jgi:hypothetical protein
MKLTIAIFIIVVILHITLLSGLLSTETYIQSKKDCSLSEISPDFTAKEKEQCIHLRGKK